MVKKGEIAEKKLRGVLAKIQKEYGDGCVRKGDEFESFERISSGSFAIDYETGGGFPRGAVTEIYGNESATKTALVLSSIAQAQRRNKKSRNFLLDIEGSYDPVWAAALGVDVGRLDVSQPEWGEKALDIFIAVLESKEYDVLALDSVAVVTAEEELGKSLEDSSMATQARLMSKCIRKLTSVIKDNPTCVLFVNQVMSTLAKYGPPETTKGGRSVKFVASLRLKMRTKEFLGGNKKSEVVGQTVAFKTEKNKTFIPRREGESVFFMSPDNPRGVLGWDWDRDVLRYGIRWGIIKKRKDKYVFGVDDVKCKDEDEAISVMNEKYQDIKEVIIGVKEARLNAAKAGGPRGFVEATRGEVCDEETECDGDGEEENNNKKDE